jgi:hypothetical protein
MGKFGYPFLSVAVQLLFSLNAAYFLVLDGPSCWRLMNRLYFIPIILVFALVGVFSFIRPPRDPKENK